MELLVVVLGAVIVSVAFRFLFPPRGPSFLRRLEDLRDLDVHP